jgi:HlyD family secretion protein
MKKWKKALLILGGVAVVAGIVYASVAMTRKGTVTVQTGKVIRQDLTSVVTASGEIKPLNYTNVSATAYGKITDILVKEGDRVRKGQMLAKLESIQPGADVEAQQANLSAGEAEATAAEAGARSSEAALRTAQADLVRSKAELEKAGLEYERAESLFKDQLISKSQYDTTKAAYEVAKAVVEQAEARVVQTRAQLEQAKSQLQTARTRLGQYGATLTRLNDVLNKFSFVAPLDGMVTNLPVHVGENMVMGIQNSPGSLLMTIADMSVITSEVKVDETDIVNVRMGQSAEVTIDAIPNKTFKGKVTEIGNSAIIRSTGLASSQSTTSSQEAKDFKVVVTLLEPPDNLRPGLSSTAKIQTANKTSAMTIPIQALTIRQKAELEEPKKGGTALAAAPDAKQREKEKEGKKEIQGVFAIRAKKALFVPVETGITGTTDIEVTSGLKEGDEIVTGSYKVLRTIRNNANVEIDNKAPKKTEDEKK